MISNNVTKPLWRSTRVLAWLGDVQSQRTNTLSRPSRGHLQVGGKAE